MELLIHDTPRDVATAASSRVAELITTSGDDFTLGLAGGSTPRATYEILRDQPISWEKVDIWLSDERWVPHLHSRSNGAMAQEALIDHIEARFHRPTWDEGLTPADSAALYETRLRSMLEGRPPDVIMLGIGDDGHTASLFPGTRALEQRDSWYVANHVPQLGEDRLTATFPLLWSAGLLLVVAVGTGKATALKTTFEGDTPAGMLDNGDASVEWHVDREAASLVR